MTPTKTPIDGRPLPGEYAEYYGQYIHLVPEGDIVTILREQIEATLGVLRTVPDDKWSYRYAPGVAGSTLRPCQRPSFRLSKTSRRVKRSRYPRNRWDD